MILKEKPLTQSSDPKLKAKEDAESQMAFYLYHALATQENCYVLNDLRIIYKTEIAQIDHLIITQYGLFIIKSESVPGKISVNKNKEWSHTLNKISSGMASPVLQTEAQGKIFKELLVHNNKMLLGKGLLGITQKDFSDCPFVIFVAIADTGMIERKTDIPELLKADQIATAITIKLNELKKQNTLLSLHPRAWQTSAEETKNIAEFILKQHNPLIKKASFSENPVATAATHSENHFEKASVLKVGDVCPVCKSHKLIRKSVKRSNNTETDFLACGAYPYACKAIYALVALAKSVEIPAIKTDAEQY